MFVPVFWEAWLPVCVCWGGYDSPFSSPDASQPSSSSQSSPLPLSVCALPPSSSSTFPLVLLAQPSSTKSSWIKHRHRSASYKVMLEISQTCNVMETLCRHSWFPTNDPLAFFCQYKYKSKYTIYPKCLNNLEHWINYDYFIHITLRIYYNNLIIISWFCFFIKNLYH